MNQMKKRMLRLPGCDVFEKEKSLLPIRKEFKWDKIRSFSRADPYGMAFVYPKPGCDVPFIIKGGRQSINQFFETYKHPALAHITLWYRGKSSYLIRIINSSCVFNRLRKSNHVRWRLEFRQNSEEAMFRGTYKILKVVKRVPRKWMKELDEYIVDKDHVGEKGDFYVGYR